MKPRWIANLISVVVLITLLAQPAAAAQSAPRAAGGASAVIPFLGLVSSWFGRNRTYRSAEAFIADRNAYYNQQLASLDKQLTEGTIFTGQGASRDAQEAAYTRVRALLEQERAAALAFAESIKKGARRDFTQSVKEEIKRIVLSTNFATRVLGALDQGFSRAIQFTNLATSDLNRLRNTAYQIQQVGSLIGGSAGQDLRNAVDNVMGFVNRQVAPTEIEINKIKQDLTNAQNQIRNLQALGYVPTSSEVVGDLAMTLVGMGPGSPSSEAILNLLGIRSGGTKQSIRVQGLALLQAGNRARCRDMVTRLEALLQELKAGSGDEIPPAKDPCNEINAPSLRKATPSPSPKPTSTTPVKQPTKPVGFEKTDCSVPGVTFKNITVDTMTDGDWNGGYLNCNDTGVGPHGLTVSHSIMITAYKGDKLDTYYQQVQKSYQSNVDQANEWNAKPNLPASVRDEIAMLRSDADGYIYMITREANVQKCFSGSGFGVEKVSGKYLVQIHHQSCEGNAAAYIAMMKNLEKAALAAIQRVESAGRP